MKNLAIILIGSALLIQPLHAGEDVNHKKEIEELKNNIKANEDYIRAVDATVMKLVENAVKLEERIKELENK